MSNPIWASAVLWAVWNNSQGKYEGMFGEKIAAEYWVKNVLRLSKDNFDIIKVKVSVDLV